MWVGSGLFSYFSNETVFSIGALDMMVKRLISVINVSVLNPACAIFAFCAFSKIRTNSRIIKLVSPTTFGIYLLHDSYVGRILIWSILVDFNAIYLSNVFPVLALAIVISIFAVCCILDFLITKPIENRILEIVDKQKNLLVNKEF